MATHTLARPSSTMTASLRVQPTKCEFCDITFNCDIDANRHLKTNGHIEKVSTWMMQLNPADKNMDKKIPRNIGQVMDNLSLRSERHVKNLQLKHWFTITNEALADTARDFCWKLLKNLMEFEAHILGPETERSLLDKLHAKDKDRYQPKPVQPPIPQGRGSPLDTQARQQMPPPQQLPQMRPQPKAPSRPQPQVQPQSQPQVSQARRQAPPQAAPSRSVQRESQQPRPSTSRPQARPVASTSNEAGRRRSSDVTNESSRIRKRPPENPVPSSPSSSHSTHRNSSSKESKRSDSVPEPAQRGPRAYSRAELQLPTPRIAPPPPPKPDKNETFTPKLSVIKVEPKDP